MVVRSMKHDTKGINRRRVLIRGTALTVLLSASAAAGFSIPANAPSSFTQKATVSAVGNSAKYLNDNFVLKASTGTPIVAAVPTPDNKGYWLVGPDGSVYTAGDAGNFGSLAGKALNQPIVGMASTPDGKGYWLVAKDGGIFSFGDAQFYGSTGNMKLNQPIVGMAATATGHGYWLVASDGGIFTFGDAKFYGSTGNIRLNQPVVGMAATTTGGGYWLVARDGGIFTFGDAKFYGSTGAMGLTQPIVGMAATTKGGGYWLTAQDGSVYSFGSATYYGGGNTVAAGKTFAGITASSTGGYILVTTTGSAVNFGPGTTPTPTPAPTPTSSVSNPTAATGNSAGSTWNNYGVTSDASLSFPDVSYYEQSQPAPASAGYGFLLTQNSSSNVPVRWNPCQAINYELNLQYAPANGQSLVQQSLAEITNATGIQFNYVGTTSTLPTLNRPSTVQTPSGLEWSPVLIAWEPNGATDYLSGSGVIGMGGSAALYTGTRWEYVTGEAAFSSTYPATAEQEASLVLHELGHVIGLGHVADPTQVMNPVDNFNAPTTYQAGDLAGLAHLGEAAGCLTEPNP